MAYSIVQKKTGGTGYVNTFTIVFDSSVTAGNTIVIGIGCEVDGEITSISDTASNSYTRRIENESTDGRVEAWVAENVTGGFTTITLNVTGGIYNPHAFSAWEVSGLAAASYDVSASANAAGYTESHSTGTTTTPAQNDNMVVAIAGLKGSGTPSYTATGYTSEAATVSNNAHIGMLHKRITSAATQGTTITHAGVYLNGGAGVLVLKEASATPTSTTLQLNADYSIRTTGSVQLDADYSVLKSGNIQTESSVDITTEDSDVIVTEDSQSSSDATIQLGADYSIVREVSLQLDADYAITSGSTDQLDADYSVLTTGSASLDADYSVSPSSTIQLDADYSILDSNSIALDADYSVGSGQTVQLGADYSVVTTQSLQLDSDYSITTPSTSQLDADYSITTIQSVELDADYSIVTEGLIQVDADYSVVIVNDLQLSADYTVIPPSTIVLGAEYSVEAYGTLELTADYTLQPWTTLELSADYSILGKQTALAITINVSKSGATVEEGDTLPTVEASANVFDAEVATSAIGVASSSDIHVATVSAIE